jgi:hypothetical protein
VAAACSIVSPTPANRPDENSLDRSPSRKTRKTQIQSCFSFQNSSSPPSCSAATQFSHPQAPPFLRWNVSKGRGRLKVLVLHWSVAAGVLHNEEEEAVEEILGPSPPALSALTSTPRPTSPAVTSPSLPLHRTRFSFPVPYYVRFCSLEQLASPLGGCDSEVLREHRGS